MSDKHREEMIIKAKRLRAKWEEWATENRSTLQELKSLDANDDVALKRFYEKLPTTGYSATGVQPRDLGPRLKSLDELSNTNVLRFTWNVFHPKGRYDSPTKWTREQIAKYHDFPLALPIGAMGVGNSQIIFWASGKITEETTTRRETPRKGESVWNDPANVTIVPSYEFWTKGK